MTNIPKSIECQFCHRWFEIAIHIPSFLGLSWAEELPTHIEKPCPFCGKLNSYWVSEQVE